jgi:hypothetical protein
MARIRLDDLEPHTSLTPEEEAAVTGAGRSFFRPQLEGLETRNMPAPATLSPSLATIAAHAVPVVLHPAILPVTATPQSNASYVVNTLSQTASTQTNLFDGSGHFVQQFNNFLLLSQNGQYQVSLQIQVPSDAPSGSSTATLTGSAAISVVNGKPTLTFSVTGDGPTRSDHTHHTYTLSGSLSFPLPQAGQQTPPPTFAGTYSNYDPHYGTTTTVPVHGTLGWLQPN